VKANRVYHLTVSRGGREPRFLAGRGRTDRVEVTSIDDGELILYFKLEPKRAARLVRQLREEMASLEAEEFRSLWDGADE